MTVHELLSRIDQRELVEWSAYEAATGPLGAERMDIWMSQILCVLTNANSKHPKKLKEFVIDWYAMWDESRRHDEQATVETDWRAMQATFAAATTGKAPRK